MNFTHAIFDHPFTTVRIKQTDDGRVFITVTDGQSSLTVVVDQKATWVFDEVQMEDNTEAVSGKGYPEAGQ